MVKDFHSSLLIGVDIGGTFTDFVTFDPISGHISTFKLLSTPSDPSKAVVDGIQLIISELPRKNTNQDFNTVITHGSTIATNTLLERKGARTALVTTEGFKDIMLIGRQDRPQLYDLEIQPQKPLIPSDLSYEIHERVDYRGQVIKKLDPDDVNNLVREIERESVESVAVSLIFSFLYPDHEALIAKSLRQQGMFVSVSSEILPEYREYERTSTTAINAYVTPILDQYLGRLRDSIPRDISHLRIMQSNGGIIGVDEARQAGVRCILSGPAGGVVGARHVAGFAQDARSDSERSDENKDILRVITFDMGGTSTDVSLVDKVPVVTTEAEVGGLPIRIPILDIHTIGAGGGSVARVDIGGALRVGPESAGADPGPACYAIGSADDDVPTVTDANVVLGRLPVDHFLGGKMKLDASRARNVMASLGKQLGLDAIQTASGVIDIVNAHMERALRLVSVERGYDPQDFFLLSFGGAGGLHACNLADQLGILRVLIPPMASTLSAFGMLVADVIKDYSRTVMLPGDVSGVELLSDLQPLIDRGMDDIHAEGFTSDMVRIERSMDLRYRGQSYELNIPLVDNYKEEFHLYHEHIYGYSRRDSVVEIVNLRVRVIGHIEPPVIAEIPSGGSDPMHASIGERRVFLGNVFRDIPLFQGELLLPGNRFSGPAIIVRSDTTIYLPENRKAIVDIFGNLIISITKS
ncbi:MAG: hydantoinase/oxoprolinase family protein [Chloroflexota bacterium]|nr:MAG: hydantoinase/oxoprolinase family protein [Chloroflexota bacterium]